MYILPAFAVRWPRIAVTTHACWLLLVALLIGLASPSAQAIAFANTKINLTANTVDPGGKAVLYFNGSVTAGFADAIVRLEIVETVNGTDIVYGSEKFRPDLTNAEVPIDTPRAIRNPAYVPAGTRTLRLKATTYMDRTGYSEPFTVTITESGTVNNALKIGQPTVPTTMIVGKTYTLSATMKNSGTRTWASTGPNAYFLGSRNPENNTTWGGWIPLPRDVPPGEQWTFSWEVTPQQAGSFDAQWRMVQKDKEWFGDTTDNIVVSVIGGIPQVRLDAPAEGSSVEGTAANGAATVRIVGSATPAAGTSIKHFYVYDKEFYVAGPLPGTSLDYSATLAAGAHRLRITAEDQNGSIGTSAVTTVSVVVARPSVTWTSPANGAQLPAGAGGTAAVRITGSATAYGGRTIRQIELLRGTEQLATSTTGTFDATVALAQGSHQLKLKAWDSAGESRESAAVNLQVVVPAPTVALSAPAGNVTVPAAPTEATVTFAGSAAPAGGTAIGLLQLMERLPSGLALEIARSTGTSLNAQVTFGIGMHTVFLRATNASGTTGESAAVTVSIVPPGAANSATFVDQQVPATMRAGQPYSLTVRMRNTGTSTWTPAGNYNLGLIKPQDGRIWNTTARAYLSGAVAPGQVAVFTVPVTAPRAPNTYAMQWQMVQDGVGWFGDKGTELAIPVTTGPGPSASLLATPANSRADDTGAAQVTFTGKGGQPGAVITKLELFQDNGKGYGATAIKTATGSGADLALSHAARLTPGVYRFKLRATNGTGVATDSDDMVVNVSGGPLLGKVDGVRTGGSNEVVLAGWACMPGDRSPVAYDVLLDAPSLSAGGKLLASGVANVATDVANLAVQQQCGTPDVSHHFRADLKSHLAAYAGRSLYVVAKSDWLGDTPLPCDDNHCTVPPTLRVGLTTPVTGDMLQSPAPLFMRAVVSNAGDASIDVGFDIEGTWIPATPDGAAGAYSASKVVAPRGSNYAVSAVVRQGKATVYSEPASVFIHGVRPPSITAQAPSAGEIFEIGKTTLFSARVNVSQSDPRDKVTSVRYAVNGVQVGEETSSGMWGLWSMEWIPKTQGTHQLVMTAHNATGKQLATTEPIPFVVREPQASSPTPVPVAITPPHLGNEDAGSIAGEIAVGSNGAATYDLAFELPPGSAGMAPKLGLSYSGVGANGVAGLGWQISGLSNIHRCGRTIAQDGIHGRIAFDQQDRLCLDGQRLVLVNGGTSDADYWSDQAEYRTEIESFSKITTQLVGGKRSFRVLRKDGRIDIYGAASGNIVAYKSPTETKSGAQLWARDRSEDRIGNFIDYLYEQDSSTGEYWLASVRYGGKGQSAHAAVEFQYDTSRPDAWKRYLDETRMDLRRRLAAVRTHAGTLTPILGDTTALRTYSLAYQQSAGSGRSLLQSVTECIKKAQGTGQQCRPPTVFTWGQPDASPLRFESRGIWKGAPVLTTWQGPNQDRPSISAINHADYFAFADFNGDGFGDVLEKRVASPTPTDIAEYAGKYREATNPIKPGTRQSSYRYFWNDGGQFTPYTYKLSIDDPFVVLEIGDFNGDGRIDLLAHTASKGAQICLSPLSNAERPAAGSTIVFNCSDSYPAVGGNFERQHPFVVDISGDGRMSHYGPVQFDGTAKLCQQSACITDPHPPEAVLAIQDPGDELHLIPARDFVAFEQMMDFSGIGKPYDLRFTRAIYTARTSPNGTRYPPAWEGRVPQVIVTGFGMTRYTAGYADVASLRYPVGPWCEGPACELYEFEIPAQGATLAGDFNGSGYSSVVFGYKEFDTVDGNVTHRKADFTVCLSTGRSLDCSVRRLVSGAAYLAPLAVGDFTGDGAPAILAEGLSTTGRNRPQRNGKLFLCRLIGDDSSATNGGADNNTRCQPIAGLTMPLTRATTRTEAPRKAEDQVYLMDLLGTGRPQLVYYHSGKIVDSQWVPDDRWEVFALADQAPAGHALDKLVAVRNGYGAEASVVYGNAARHAIVTASKSASYMYPARASVRTGPIVFKLQRANGAGGVRVSSYTYRDPAVDLHGRGDLGFSSMTVTDLGSGGAARTSTQIRYSQAWPHIGAELGTTVRTSSGGELSRVTHTPVARQIAHPNGSSTVFPYIEKTTTVSRDLDGSELGQQLTTRTYGDAWGNLTLEESKRWAASGGTFVTRVQTDYRNDPSAWLLGLPELTQVTRVTPTASQTRTTAFSYDPVTGLMDTKTIEPNDSRYRVTTTYLRTGNPFGLVSRETEAWLDPQTGQPKSRVVHETIHESLGRFPEYVTNALGQLSEFSYDSARGVLQWSRDPNNLTTSHLTNSFGDTIGVGGPGLVKRYRYKKQCDSGCPAGAAYAVINDAVAVDGRSEVPVIEYFDAVGHLLRRQTWSMDEQVSIADYSYDELGRLSTVYQPRFARVAASNAKIARRHLYDDLDRSVAVATPDEAGQLREAKTFYQGLTRAYENQSCPGPACQRTVEVRDALGQLRSTTDAYGAATKFDYAPFGELQKTVDPKGNTVTVTYDLRGRKTALLDPDTGRIEYGVDPLGLVWQSVNPVQRAKGTKTLMQYDALGRMWSQVEPDLSSYWTYDQGKAAIGKLSEAYTMAGTAKDYRRLHTYDGDGRLAKVEQLSQEGTFATTFVYDRFDRLVQRQNRRGNDDLKLFDLRYGKTGYLERIERGPTVLWKLTGQDAALRETAAQLGNGLAVTRQFDPYTGRLMGQSHAAGTIARLTEGYQYDVLGNMTQRMQYWDGTGFTENFTYDKLNRLETSKIGANLMTYGYDAIGNIVSKPNVSASPYEYPAQGANSVRPHAVQRIPGVGDFAYDDNGNLKTGAGRTMTWTSFDMPATIARGTDSATFVYGPEHQRVRQKRSDGTAIIYGGDQEVEVSAAAVTVRTYWPNGLGMEVDQPGKATELSYFHTDRLGSIVLITDTAGVAKEKLAYDPWGKRRSLDGSATPDSLRGEQQPLGFTGHEMLDKQGLVHMNGRVYDPLIGRFLSADALVEDPDNGQAYNRYSYVLNNPTNRVDPTGYASCSESAGSDCPVENKVEVKGKREEKKEGKDIGTFSDYRTVGVTAGMLVIRQVGSFGSSSSRAPTAKLGGASLAGVSTNRGAPTQPEKNHGDHWAQYKRDVPFSAGDGPSTNATGYDDWAHGNGFMGSEQWSERAAARGAGAGIGIGAVAGGAAVAEAPVIGGALIVRLKKMLSLSKPLSKEAEKSIRTLEKRISEHEQKLADFKANPTVRPGMENLPKEVIEKAQLRRIRHLEAEIQTFKNNIDKILNGQ
ncbi:RHS repeat-associated core domain-containing protein [Pseudoduganella armeniaca]|uniref:Uncharacterized protein n=1 Tax=Pseudoduganella armeniaca TaxID=2072590 RepID=A0A2R4C648_9BURK|nr:RHS repeat-associated core domain-containing protein [Pseudoduganella armeniaca]AVR95107.1 hypothetical protein C9I28_04755 [Pseudoduganella armeniaca]